MRCSAPAEYLFCQPWPFPSSLMIGLILQADDDRITVDPHELETARWFTREEAKAMMAGQHPDAYRADAFRHRPPRAQGVARNAADSIHANEKRPRDCSRGRLDPDALSVERDRS